MNEKQRPVLLPQYIRSFRCIGSACEDSCCVGWNVDVDHRTYKKYRNLRDKELGPLLDKFIKRNRSNASETHYAKIRINKDGTCPFLDQDMLCRIQLNKGEDCLSDICATYPRIVNLVNGVLERSATMSCPEAARIALLNSEGLEFDEVEEIADERNMITKRLFTSDAKMVNKPEKYLWELRIFTITVLQNRKFTLDERLLILGMFYIALQELIENSRICDIPQLIAKYTDLTQDTGLKESLSGIPAQYNIQMELLKEVAERRCFMDFPPRAYLQCLGEFMAGIQYTSDATVEEVGQRYKEAYETFYKPFMNDHEYIFENFLVNHVFKNLFPFTGDRSVFEAYVAMVLQYALIKMHLIGMAAYHQGLTAETVVSFISITSRTFEHNSRCLRNIFDLLRQNGYLTIAYMGILIKN